ncbi:putative uncharacterized protein [Ruminococcus sp. CAG:403]|nr:putative uncharacterized protein [Ruminococcus sp. CAG:403]
MTFKQQGKNKQIIDCRSFQQQLEQAEEEAAEFLLAAQKLKRFPDNKERHANLIEETADLLIMMEQMRVYLGCESVDKVVDYKLDREIKRIEEAEENATGCA